MDIDTQVHRHIEINDGQIDTWMDIDDTWMDRYRDQIDINR